MQNSNPIKEKLQQDALNKFTEHFYNNHNTRGILCACCGYGKSYLMYKILKKCIDKGERLFIIATSRIKLLEQLGPDIVKWNKKENNKINLQVSILCSDDIYKNSIRNIDNKLNINENQIIDKITNRKINTANIFLTTYNSATKLVEKISGYNKEQENNELLSDNSIEPDLIILDEAHNTVGTGKSNNNEKFHHELFKNNEYFNASKYLFMTATPLILKHKNPHSKINTEETLYSMNKENIYGKIFYYYSFAQGIKDKIITNFQTIHLKPNKDFLEKADNKNNFNKDKSSVLKLSKEEQQQLYFRDISTLLIESMVKYKFHKTIIYIGNKDKAEIFKNILEKIKSKIEFDIFKIVSDSNNSSRRNEEKKFIKSKKAVLIAVNIYNEGVDIPCVDSVMFAEERNSQTTIVQNIGRCLRLDDNKLNKIAFVIIPNILYEMAGSENNEFFASKFINIRNCIKIIKDKTDRHFFEKYTDNKKNIDDEDNEIDATDEEINMENVCENNDDDVNNNIEQSEKDKYQIQLLKYYSINGTFDGCVSNRTLEDIRNKYIIDKKCNDIKKYGNYLRKNCDDHILRTDIEYKSEWISWDYFFNNRTISYKNCKENIKEMQSFIKIKNIQELFDIYNFVINCELELYNEYDEHYKFELFDKLDNIKRRNKNNYDKLLRNILQIPYQPKKFFTSSNEWISVEDFLNLNEINVNVNNGNGSKESVELDKNIKNILNNDDIKIKKGRYLYLKNIDIPVSIINYLKKEHLLNDKFKLYIRARLTKNSDLYESGEILIMDIINENIFGKIILNEYKLECDKNLLLKSNLPKDKIEFNMKLCLNNIYNDDIDNLINKIKDEINIDKIATTNKIFNNEPDKEIILDNDILVSLKRDNIIIIDDTNNIETKKSNFLDDELEKYDFNNHKNNRTDIKTLKKEYVNTKDKTVDINKLIQERTNTKDQFIKNKLLIEIQKVHPNYGKIWIEGDKSKLKKSIIDNVDLTDMSQIFGRNEGGIISQIKTMVGEGSINKNDLNDDIYNKIYL